MLGFVKTLCLTVILGLALHLSSGATDAWAEDDETHFNLEAAWFVNPSGRGYRIEFEAALEGYCSPLLAKIRPDEIDWTPENHGRIGLRGLMRYWAAVRMHDSGLCVESDPMIGTRFFNHWIDTTPFHSGIVFMELGWRAWHGFGTARDRERARGYFEKSVVRDLELLSLRRHDGRYTRTGMSLPPYAVALADFFRNQASTPPKRLALASAMLDGDVTFPDGRAVPIDYISIANLVSLIPYHAEANYISGLVRREMERRGIDDGFENSKDKWGEEMRMSTFYMENASHCNHREATKLLVEWLLEDLERGDGSPSDLIVALLRLNELGFETEDAIREIEARFPDRYRTRDDNLRAMHHFTKRRDECESFAAYSKEFNHRYRDSSADP